VVFSSINETGLISSENGLQAGKTKVVG